MLSVTDSLTEMIVGFLAKNGIDTFYAGTILMILLCIIIGIPHLKNWDKVSKFQKDLDKIGFTAAIIFSLLSMLRLAGILT
jgi:hypothetical protein